jgi:hypothetical protein
MLYAVSVTSGGVSYRGAVSSCEVGRWLIDSLSVVAWQALLPRQQDNTFSLTATAVR